MIVKRMNSLVSKLLIGLVWVYRVTLGWLLGGQCRYTPSCSEYFAMSVKKYGPWRGAAKGVWRILRCHPFARGGYDLP